MVDVKERAVRRYLAYLADPEAAVDDDRVADLIVKLEQQFVNTSDPIVKLRVRSSIERARRPDRAALEADFARYAYEWALANDIVPAAFRSMGVDPELLEKAGLGSADEFESNTPSEQMGSKSRKSMAKNSARNIGRFDTVRVTKRQNRPPVRLDQIFPAIRKQTNRFTIAQIHVVAGGSIGSARTAVLSLVASGEVQAVGKKAGARGKAPVEYEVVRRS
jgi:hypothetical protein